MHGQLFAEVHRCKLENVDEMIGKREGTRRLLAGSLGIEVKRWIWLAPPGAPITIRRGTSQERRLALARIEMPRRVLRTVDLVGHPS